MNGTSIWTKLWSAGSCRMIASYPLVVAHGRSKLFGYVGLSLPHPFSELSYSTADLFHEFFRIFHASKKVPT